MKFEKLIFTILIVIVLLFVGELYITEISAIADTGAAILYLAAVFGGGCFWIGSNK